VGVQTKVTVDIQKSQWPHVSDYTVVVDLQHSSHCCHASSVLLLHAQLVSLSMAKLPHAIIFDACITWSTALHCASTKSRKLIGQMCKTLRFPLSLTAGWSVVLLNTDTEGSNSHVFGSMCFLVHSVRFSVCAQKTETGTSVTSHQMMLGTGRCSKTSIALAKIGSRGKQITDVEGFCDHFSLHWNNIFSTASFDLCWQTFPKQTLKSDCQQHHHHWAQCQLLQIDHRWFACGQHEIQSQISCQWWHVFEPLVHCVTLASRCKSLCWVPAPVSSH